MKNCAKQLRIVKKKYGGPHNSNRENFLFLFQLLFGIAIITEMVA